MARLRIRKIDFQFGNDIRFQFNPDNRPWSNFVNYITLIAPGFERYFIRAVRSALPQISDFRVREDVSFSANRRPDTPASISPTWRIYGVKS